MPDNKSNKGPADASRVNVNEDYEVQFWTKKFGCSEEALKRAVKSVGVMAVDVERSLKGK